MSPFHLRHLLQALSKSHWQLSGKKNKQTLFLLLTPWLPTQLSGGRASCPFHCLSLWTAGIGALWAEIGQLGLRNNSVKGQVPFPPSRIFREGAKSQGWRRSYFVSKCTPNHWPSCTVIRAPLPLMPLTYPTSRLHQCKHWNIARICPCLSIFLTPIVHLTWDFYSNLFLPLGVLQFPYISTKFSTNFHTGKFKIY